MFYVTNKDKIVSTVIALSTVLVLFLIATTIKQNNIGNTIQTSASTSKMLPIYSVDTEENRVALTINCAWNVEDIDLILVMSVEPGFGGQAFQTKILKKIEVLDTFRKNKGLSYKIEVDGGINNLTINEVVKSGADIVVVGSYLFKQDLETAFKTLRESIL